MKTKFQIALIALLSVVSCQLSVAQTNTSTSPPSPFDQATNQTGATLIFNAALNLLPKWDPTQTNDFAASEFTLESAPLWKTATASGTTPYNSTEADYFFTRNIAFGGELISLGSGTGSSTIDSGNVLLTLRKDVGNIAGYLLLDTGYNVNDHRLQGGGGPGLIYQYQTHVRLFVDTRFNYEGNQVTTKAGVTTKQGSGFFTRIGMQIPF